jgi:hypothetical protein
MITARTRLGTYLPFATSVVLFCIFYRGLIASGFDKIPGDDGDSFLYLYILEHWYRRLFLGQGGWLASSSLFPLANTLGYSDCMFLFALPYGFLRALSLDLVTAYQFTLMLAHIIGYATFYWLLRSVLLLRRGPALLGASLATLNNAFYVSIGHTQLFTIGLIPPAMLLAATFLRRAYGPARIRRLAGAGLAILLPLMLYTGYYVTWFLIFFGFLISAILLLADCLARRATGVATVWRWFCGQKAEVLAYLLLALTAFMPFVVTYLPTVREIGGRKFVEVRATLPNWFDFANVGPANLLWGSLFRHTFPDANTRPLSWELTKGVAPETLLLFLIGTLWGVWSLLAQRRVRKSDSTLRGPASELAGLEGRQSILPVLAAVLAAGVLISWLLLLRVDDYSSWWLVHKIFPGGTAIRAVFRFQHVLMFPVAVVIAVLFDAGWGKLNAAPSAFKTTVLRVLLVAAGALALAEQYNAGDYYLASKSALLAELGNVPPAPPVCHLFFLTPPRQHTRQSYGFNTEAMLIAQRAGIPTLNAYTSGPPPNWGLSDIYAPDYIFRVVAWLDLHEMHNDICSLSAETWQWNIFDSKALPRPFALDGPLPNFGYYVRLEMIAPPQVMRAGEQRAVSVRVVNIGPATLSGIGRNAVRLSYQWTDSEGKTDGFNYRKDLPVPLGPGQSVVMTGDLRAPNQPGRYHLDLDLVQEFVAWFRDKGGVPYSTEVSVVAP